MITWKGNEEKKKGQISYPFSFLVHSAFWGLHREGSGAQDFAAVTEGFGGFQSLEFSIWGLSP